MTVVLVLRLGVIALTLMAWRRARLACLVACFGSAVASVVTALMAAEVLRTSTRVQGVWLIHRASGFALTYTIDGLSAWFLVVLSVLAVPIAIFSADYVLRSHFRGRSLFIGVAFNVLVGALELVFTADGVIGFLFAWEAFTLVAAALVATAHEASRQPPGRLPVSGHVARGHRLPDRRVPRSGGPVRLA